MLINYEHGIITGFFGVFWRVSLDKMGQKIGPKNHSLKELFLVKNFVFSKNPLGKRVFGDFTAPYKEFLLKKGLLISFFGFFHVFFTVTNFSFPMLEIGNFKKTACQADFCGIGCTLKRVSSLKKGLLISFFRTTPKNAFFKINC